MNGEKCLDVRAVTYAKLHNYECQNQLISALNCIRRMRGTHLLF